MALLGVGEVEAVGGRDGKRTSAGHIARSLTHRCLPTGPGIELAVPFGAVERDGNGAIGAGNAHHAGISTGAADGARSHKLVVLLKDPSLAGHVGITHDRQPRGGQIIWLGHVGQINGRGRRRRILWHVSERHVVGEVERRNAHHLFATPQGLELARVGDLTDVGGVQFVARGHLHHCGQGAGLNDGQHALLTLAHQHLAGGKALLAKWHAVEINCKTHAAPAGHLAGSRRKARGAQILKRHKQAGLAHGKAQVDELALGKWVAHLHARTLVGVVVAHLSRCQHACAADAVAAGAVADEHQAVADALRSARQDALLGHDSHAHGVDQAGVLVAVVKLHLTANVGDADAVAVVANAIDRAAKQKSRTLAGEGPEPQGVEQRDGLGAHGDDVAHNAAHAGGGALKGLHGARVVVALNLEHNRQTVANVNRAGILARAHHHTRAGGGKPLEQRLGVLVRAVLTPHEREHHQLGVGGRAAHQTDHALVLGLEQPEFLEEWLAGVSHRRAHASSAAKSARPSTDPSSGSQASSGCGMSPITLPARLLIPAILSTLPLGFSPR